MKLNLGCGGVQPEGWTNVDYSLGARLSKIPLYRPLNNRFKVFDVDSDGLVRQWKPGVVIADLTKRFPWPDHSAECIYTSHTLEHFSREEGLHFLSECRRVLGPGGILRIIVPDVRHIIEEYLKGAIRADRLVERLGVLYERRPHPLKNILAPLTQFPHRCMYDAPSLLQILSDLGFSASPKQPFESAIPDIRNIELAERTEHAVIVEGTRM